MSKDHTLRVRAERWEKIEKTAWKLSQKAEKFIKPTDIADALFYKYAESITIKDIEEAKINR